MRVLKSALVISSAVFLCIACSTSEPANHNANQSGATASNANAAPASPGANANSAAASPAGASANSNEPAKIAVEKKKDDSKAPAASKPVSAIDAAALYTANKCATCHGADGKGKIKNARDFTDPAWQKKESDAKLAAAIRNGKKPMPPYGEKLSNDEINALVAYVRSFAKK